VTGNDGGLKKWDLERRIAVDTRRMGEEEGRNAGRRMGTETNRTQRVIKCAVE